MKISSFVFCLTVILTSKSRVKNSTMNSILGLSFALVCVFSAYSQAQTATQYDPKSLPEGLYLTRWWHSDVNPLTPPSGEDITTFNKTGPDTYEVIFVHGITSATGFYSSSSGSFSGGYYEEGEDGREEGDYGWGGFLLHWNGVTLSGRWIQFGDKVTGYIIFYPLNSTYTLTSAQTLISEGHGK